MNDDTDEPFVAPALVMIEWSVLRPFLVSRVDPQQRRREQRHADTNSTQTTPLGQGAASILRRPRRLGPALRGRRRGLGRHAEPSPTRDWYGRARSFGRSGWSGQR